MAEPVRILAVVLHYGDPALAAQVQEQLAGADSGLSGRVRVYDNAAPVSYPGAWRRATDNLYWAGALEDCVSLAREEGFTHLWFLNNDIEFVSRPPFMARAAAHLWRLGERLGHDVGVWAPAVLRSPYHPQMVHREGVAFSRVAVADGIAPVYALDCIEAIGGVDAVDNPYGYGVDVWLSLRAHHAGWPVIVDHGVVVRHRHHTTARTLDGFLDTAGRAEDAYMTQRLGPAWRDAVRTMQQNIIHERIQ